MSESRCSGSFRLLNPEARALYWSGSRRMGTFFNDIHPRNIGANAKIFDPAIDPLARVCVHPRLGNGGWRRRWGWKPVGQRTVLHGGYGSGGKRVGTCGAPGERPETTEWKKFEHRPAVARVDAARKMKRLSHDPARPQSHSGPHRGGRRRLAWRTHCAGLHDPNRRAQANRFGAGVPAALQQAQGAAGVATSGVVDAATDDAIAALVSAGPSSSPDA